MKRVIFLFSFLTACVVFLLLTPQHTDAFTIRSGNSIVIPKNETIDGTLIVAGQHVRIDGNVNGDIFCAGQNIDVTGTVDGDVICAGQNITVGGIVNGNIRTAGQTVLISGEVARNVTAFNQTFTNNAIIGGDLFAMSQDFTTGGIVKKDTHVFAQSATIDGLVNRNATFFIQDLRIGSQGHISGNLDYTSKKTMAVATGEVGGKIYYHEYKQPYRPQREFFRSFWIITLIISIIVHLLFALLFVGLFPAAMVQVTTSMKKSAGRALGIGALILFGTPIVLLFLIITIIGIPAAIVLGILYALTIFVSRLLVSIAVGRQLTSTYWKAKKDSLAWSASVGVIVSYLFFALPFIGWLFSLTAILWGLGGVWYLFRPPQTVKIERRKK